MASGLEGFAELDRQLAALGASQGGKVLRNSVAAAIRPAFNKAKATVPVGTVAHKTYKGRLVAPGFASRSLRIVSFKAKSDQGASAVIGVKAEAFYALQFLELGTAKIPKAPWLVPAFESSQQEMIDKFGQAARQRIEAAARKK